MGKISEEEEKKALQQLRGLSDQDKRDVKNKLSGYLDREGSRKGISKEELKDAMDDMRNHKSQHHLSSKQIDEVEKELKEDLND
jgi:hypothetical protein